MMKIPSLGALKGFGVAVVLLSASQAHSSTQTDSSYEKYRCIVLGDDSACHPQKVTAAPYRLVPGSYTRYLMINDGMSEADALSAARSTGEEPTWQLTIVEPPQHLSGYQAYARVMGLSDLSQPEPSTSLSRSN